MNMHPCAWASRKGRELRLSCPERVTLWQLAERAAVKGHCWPSLVQLMEDTGLAKATLVSVVRRLADLALIRIEKVGQNHIYHMLQPVQNKTSHRSKSEPADRSKSEPATGSKTAPDRFKNVPRTGSNLNPNLKENLKRTNGAREDTRQAAASVREPENEITNSGNHNPAAPPATPTEPSEPSTTPDGTTDPFGDWLADGTPAAHPGRPVLLEAETPESITEDDAPRTEADRARMAAQLAALAQQLAQAKRAKSYPPRAAILERHEQIDALTPRPSMAKHLPPEVLAQIRRQAGYGARL